MDNDDLVKRCYACKLTKPLSDFHANRSRKDGLTCRCKSCTNTYARNHRKNHPDLTRLCRRRSRLLKEYGISVEDYNEKLRLQDTRCAICGCSPTTSLAVDHNHITGQIRSLLCIMCNLVVGQIEHRPDLLPKIIAYLQQWDTAVKMVADGEGLPTETLKRWISEG